MGQSILFFGVHAQHRLPRRLILLLQSLNVLELLIALWMTPRRPRFLRLSPPVVVLGQQRGDNRDADADVLLLMQ